ncbi:MAG TPA: hypothetical protein VLJ39_17940, partial [Tepidisphaeraceae bacterium]|nr:hypothetical protein [Tepidisphaeraceae bacterium]
RVQAEQDTLRDARPVDFAAAAREWAREILRDPLQRLGMEGRLSAAAQAEAIRDDADLIRARDLELASRAVAAVTAAARTGARSKTEAFTNSIVNDLEILCSAWASPDTRQANAAGKARRDLMRLAAGPGSTIATATRGSAAGGEDRQKDAENLAMQASAAAANHQYQDAANLDRALIHRIQGGGKHDTAPSGVDLESTPSDRVEHHEQAVEREMSTAKQLDDLGQVQKKLGSQGGAATELADRQQSVADKIAEVEKDHQGSAPVAPDAGNGRDRAAAEILAAQEQLSSMPQALAAVGSAAAGRREAAMRAGMAHNTAGLAPPDQRDAASRAADEADQTAAEAAGRLTGALQPVSAGVAQALSDRLEPFAPESDAARAAIVGQLVPALQALQQAVKGDDAGAVDRAAGDARKAIESCQRELSAAQNLLMQRDPLVAARWFAKAAAESLSSMPPDLSHAKSHQANVTAALSRAWDQSIHRAAAERLSAIPSMASVLDPAIPPGNGAAPQQASKFAAAREWGRLRPPEGPDVNASMHDADPAGYEESLKLYFEALGKAQASK